ncbi:hypothetical protein V0288_23305 [Pannus brasiliensis CCIBt3594]|uniref:Uncharacterized protein n=1 Tax=Pannus brasiliensis CCIBt3594 TaxID=1427578 RepID=A0AAW9R136_9CHRO
MNNDQRLADLEKNLQISYKKLGEFERQLIIKSDPSVRFQLQQEIEEDILPKILEYEREYWEIYPLEAVVIPETEARSELDRIQKAVKSLDNRPSEDYKPELIALLNEINTKLDDLNQVASAKLKLVVPLIPMLASYELEMDTEGVIYKTWRSLQRLLGK